MTMDLLNDPNLHASLSLIPVFLTGVWSLAVCFRGHGLVRVMLVVWGVLIGTIGGAMLATWWRGGAASGVDLLVVCGGLCVIFTIAAWTFYRLSFALISGLVAASVVIVAFNMAQWPLPKTAGVILGLLIAAACFVCMRGIVIWVSALHGAFGAVGAVATMVAEGPENLHAMLLGPDSQRWVLPTVILFSLALAVAGAAVQFHLYRLEPDDSPESAGATGSHPKGKTPAKTGRKPAPTSAR